MRQPWQLLRGRAIRQITPLAWAWLTFASFLLLGFTFITGAAASGLDIGEKCAQAGQFFDGTYRQQHWEESQRLFPMRSVCNADFDLVPAWVNPGLVLFAFLTVAFFTAHVMSVRRSSRTDFTGNVL